MSSYVWPTQFNRIQITGALFLSCALSSHSALAADVEYFGNPPRTQVTDKAGPVDFVTLSTTTPVRAQITGPATLNIEVRAVLKKTAKKSKPVQITVLIDANAAKVVKTDLKALAKNTKATLTDAPKDSLPSAPYRFSMPVDAGTFFFELRLGGKEKSVLVALSTGASKPGEIAPTLGPVAAAGAGGSEVELPPLPSDDTASTAPAAKPEKGGAAKAEPAGAAPGATPAEPDLPALPPVAPAGGAASASPAAPKPASAPGASESPALPALPPAAPAETPTPAAPAASANALPAMPPAAAEAVLPALPPTALGAAGVTASSPGMTLVTPPATWTTPDEPGRQFYVVQKNKALKLNLVGPGQLQIETRRNVPKGIEKNKKRKTKPLVVSAKIDGNAVGFLSLRDDPSPKRYAENDKLVPTEPVKMQLSIPAGKHTCQIQLPKPDANGITVALDYGSDLNLKAPIMQVGRGSYLSAISHSSYGRDDYWPAIYEVNRGTIGENPDHVQVGTRLVVPSEDETKAIMEWIGAGRQPPPPPILVQLQTRADSDLRTLLGAQAEGKIPGDLLHTDGPVGESIRRQLDEAVASQVELFLTTLVEIGAIESVPLVVGVDSEKDSDIEVLGSDITLDGKPIKLEVQGSGGDRKTLIGKGDLLPGSHRIDAAVRFRHTGGGVFTYVQDQTFQVKGGRVFLAQAGKRYHVAILMHATKDLTAAFKDRVAMRIDVVPTIESSNSPPEPHASAPPQL